MKSIAPTLAAIAFAFAGLAGPTSAQEKTVSDAKPVKVVMETSKGTIELELDAAKAPKTVANFVSYVKKAHYDGTIFHRVIPGFMIQGGCPLGTGTGGPGYTFKDEPHPELTFEKPYQLAMANAGPGTNGSQFFITVGPTTWLNFKHTIFGEVADQESRDVVDAIATTTTGPGDRPTDPVVIETVEIRNA